MESTKKKKMQFPHPVIFLLLLALLMLILSWIIPAGHYMAIDANGVVQGAEGYDTATGTLIYDDAHFFQESAPARLGIWAAIQQIVNGFLAGKSVIFLILCAFSAITLIEKTGALDAMVASCVRMTERRPKMAPVMIVVIMYLMALWGGTGTLSYEEIGAFIPIFLLLCVSLGYDPIVALASCAMSMGFGFASGYANPFTTGTAHNIVGLQPLSGAGYRIIVLIVTVGFLAFYTLRYGAKVKKDPSLSITADIDFSHLRIDEERKATKFTPVRICTLIALVIMVGVMFYELMFKGQFIDCCTALFLSLMFIIMAIRWFVPLIQNAKAGKEVEKVYLPSDTIRDWFDGMGQAALPAMIVGFAYGVSNIMSAGGIKDPMIHAMVGLLGKTNVYISIVLMFIFQTFLNFIIPSGSGQAGVAMPIIGPIAQGIGMNLQSATLAFNFGDGYSNLLWPTAYAVMLPTLAGIPVGRYYKWFGKLFFFTCIILIILLEISLIIWQGVY